MHTVCFSEVKYLSYKCFVTLNFLILVCVTCRKNYLCTRKEIALEPRIYDTVIANSEATSGTSKRLEKSSETKMTINSLYNTTGEHIDIMMSNPRLYCFVMFIETFVTDRL